MYIVLHGGVWRMCSGKNKPLPCVWTAVKPFDAELPDSNIAMHSGKFPAVILVPGMLGWLFQMTSFLLHFLLVQVEVTTAIVPTCLVFTSGFSALQKWQNLKSTSSCERKTINFGCLFRLSSLIYTLYREQRVTKQLYNFDHLHALRNSSIETPLVFASGCKHESHFLLLWLKYTCRHKCCRYAQTCMLNWDACPLW